MIECQNKLSYPEQSYHVSTAISLQCPFMWASDLHPTQLVVTVLEERVR